MGWTALHNQVLVNMDEKIHVAQIYSSQYETNCDSSALLSNVVDMYAVIRSVSLL